MSMPIIKCYTTVTYCTFFFFKPLVSQDYSLWSLAFWVVSPIERGFLDSAFHMVLWIYSIRTECSAFNIRLPGWNVFLISQTVLFYVLCFELAPAAPWANEKEFGSAAQRIRGKTSSVWRWESKLGSPTTYFRTTELFKVSNIRFPRNVY